MVLLGSKMNLFYLKMMLLIINANRNCFLRAPKIMNKIIVFSTRTLNCKLPLESILSYYFSKNEISRISKYIARGGYLLYMPFEYCETR